MRNGRDGGYRTSYSAAPEEDDLRLDDINDAALEILYPQRKSEVKLSCTCGSAEQLEEERLRLIQQNQGIGDRGGRIALRESEMEQRVQDLEENAQGVVAGKRSLKERKAEVDKRIRSMDDLVRDAVGKEEAVRELEEVVEREADVLHEVEEDANQQEEALAREELELIEERNRIEDDLEQLRLEHANICADMEALAAKSVDIDMKVQEALQRQENAKNDQEVLAQIEVQIGPVRAGIIQREKTLVQEESDLLAEEADFKQREALVVPEWRDGAEAFAINEARKKEMRLKEEEGDKQKHQLVKRQRELGDVELQLAHREAELQRREAANAGGNLQGPSGDSEGIRFRIDDLRRSEADWAEKAQFQQRQIAALEAQMTSAEDQLRRALAQRRGAQARGNKH